MSHFRRSLIALVVILSGMALVPYVALPAQEFSWQRYPQLYGHEPTPSEQPTSTTAPEVPAEPSLMISPDVGAPGSFFRVSVADLAANATATISINGHVLGSLTTDAAGGLVFVLSSANADVGEYLVMVSTNPSVSGSFRIAADAPVSPLQGDAQILDIPAGLVVAPPQPTAPPPATLPNTGAASGGLFDALLVLLLVALGSTAIGLLLRGRRGTA